MEHFVPISEKFKTRWVIEGLHLTALVDNFSALPETYVSKYLDISIDIPIKIV